MTTFTTFIEEQSKRDRAYISIQLDNAYKAGWHHGLGKETGGAREYLKKCEDGILDKLTTIAHGAVEAFAQEVNEKVDKYFKSYHREMGYYPTGERVRSFLSDLLHKNTQ